LPEGSKISGPALLVQPDATIYIDPGLYAVVDDFGNIIMKQEVK
jgi:N-methylhydantoinase A